VVYSAALRDRAKSRAGRSAKARARAERARTFVILFWIFKLILVLGSFSSSRQTQQNWLGLVAISFGCYDVRDRQCLEVFMRTEQSVSGHRPSRRSFLQISGAASAALAGGILSERMLAAAEWPKAYPSGAVIIDSNENPLGPCVAARDAIAGITAQGGRYCPWLAEDLIGLFARAEGLKPEYVRAFPGSSEPLHYTVLAYTSPTKSYVTADPGYEAGMHAAKFSGARIAKVPLTASYSHDVKAMLAAGPDAGLFYICTPNNPTGTLTSHADIEHLLQNKPKGSIA